jgi:hypothetical protein
MSLREYNISSGDVSAAKEQIAHAERPGSLESADSAGFDEQRTKTLLRRLDWHLVPFLALLYLYEIPKIPR